MPTKPYREIEAKILNVNPKIVQKKLREIGARLERTLDLDQVIWWTNSGTSIRVRKSSDGNVRLTMKKTISGELGFNEWETEVEIYEKTITILDEALRTPNLRIEFPHRRQDWRLGETLININWFPKVAPLVEIEAKSEKVVRDVATKLGFNPKNLVNKGIVGILAETLHLKKGDKIKLR